ncbi:MAG TPA: hypothetical protein VE623_05675 [Acidimicrobiales bacterium]|jgi:transposase-like protein|nr:hypothetical protein [Acidimicrobiales bacterium]
MPDPSRQRDRAGRRAKRFLSPAEKYQAFVQVLTGEMTVAQCAEHWGVDRSTIMKAREVAKQGALAALAASRPGGRADGEDPELLAARHETACLQAAANDPSQRPPSDAPPEPDPTEPGAGAQLARILHGSRVGELSPSA